MLVEIVSLVVATMLIYWLTKWLLVTAFTAIALVALLKAFR